MRPNTLSAQGQRQTCSCELLYDALSDSWHNQALAKLFRDYDLSNSSHRIISSIYEAHSTNRFDGARVSILHRYEANPLQSSKRLTFDTGKRLQKQVLTSTHHWRFLRGCLHSYH